MAGPIVVLIICLLLPFLNCQDDQKVTLADFGDEQFSQGERHYLIYDINHGEGFNLRRDVYMRIANTVRQLREKGHNYVLVLPPWAICTTGFEDFLQVNGDKIDLVLYLQAYPEGWSEDEGYTLKYDKKPCIDAYHYYAMVEDAVWKGFFFTYEKVYASELECLSIQGQSSTLADAIIKDFPKPMSLFVDRAETILHDRFGDVFYWKARRSMRYAKKLVEIGNRFRLEHFNSTDQTDRTPLADDWEMDKLNHNQATGGNYIQIVEQMNIKEVEVLEQQLDHLQPTHVHRFLAEEMSDAAVSIVDQWVCAHARHFVGTHLSTFSFRIHEDREILGSPLRLRSIACVLMRRSKLRKRREILPVNSQPNGPLFMSSDQKYLLMMLLHTPVHFYTTLIDWSNTY
uniref:GDP-fucose protein O-fucosyltransferase 2 n=1 Tax=Ditylenchus dipsaci TaxID=166011 RepID=A0A915D7K3_9BILA